jgi:uncharacterized repeat protein (TIGR01451 family)
MLLACAATLPVDGGAVQLPATVDLWFQTGGPARCASIGDWYTSRRGGAGCGNPTAPSGNPGRHEVRLRVVDETGSATLRVFDAESAAGSGDLDEVIGGQEDPVRFWVEDPDGVVTADVTLPGGTAHGRTLTFSLGRPGVWILRTVTGAEPLFGDATEARNDDDNAWRLETSDGVRIEGFEASLQHDGGGRQDVDFRFAVLVDPSVSALRLRNYDADGGASIVYRRPDGSTVSGSTSGNGRWNGSGGVDTGEDVLSGLGNGAVGLWTLEVNRWTPNNQLILEVRDQDGRVLPFTDGPAEDLLTVLGSWAFGADGERTTRTGVAALHPLRVENDFSVADRTNLSAAGTAPGWEAVFVDTAGTPLPDTDGDGRPDTGVLAPGGALDLALRLTPSAGAVNEDTTVVTAESVLAAGLGRAPATRTATLRTRVPQLVIDKTATTLSDPVSGTVAPKAVPGAEIAYRLTVSNVSGERPDRGSVVVTDRVPAGTRLFLGDLDGPGSGPVRFEDGAGADRSGLSYTFDGLADPGDDLVFSCDGGLSWGAAGCPGVPDADGYGPAVTHLRVVPGRRMRRASGARVPTFTLEFRVRVE